MIFIYSINRWLKLKKTGLTLFNIALLTHNLGSFGFYNWTWGFLGYDNLVHFVGSFVAAYIIFNFVSRKLHIKKNQRVKNTVIDEHKVIFIFLVIATVAFLGVCIELLEYSGFVFLGSGDGILFAGAGDSGDFGSMEGQYIDTMGDIIVNILGTITGVLVFYFARYKKKPWLRY